MFADLRQDFKPAKLYGIKRRWLVNSLTATLLIVLAGIVAFSLSVYSYYYSGMEAGLQMKAKTATDFFANYITKTYAEYYQSAYRYTERFDERDKLELQFISTAGRVEVSTYGITAGSRPGTPDIAVAQDTHAIAMWHGRNPTTGERIISVTSPMLYSDGRMVGMMRYVSSMEKVDHLVLLNIFAACGIGAAILALMAGASLFFIRSIIAPIQEVTSMTRAIADGGYGAQIDNRYDDEIGEMVNSINEMSMKISQSEKMKTEFISSVSHELRTPLTAIAGWGETLLYGEGLSSDAKRGLNIILKEARRLATMVEELLDFTRIEDGKFTVRLEPCDVEIVLEDAVATYAEVFRQDGLKLSYEPLEEPLAEIPGDPVRLKQVFLNILDNAAKYGRDGKMIEVGIGVIYDGSKEWVCISIRDYGPGIPEDDLEQVKLKFYKGSSKERGSGIGLAVCDEIVKRHSGRLTLENAIGGGIEVTVLLPKPSSSRKGDVAR